MSQSEAIRSHLEDIIKWMPLLDDVTATLYGISGHGFDTTATTTLAGSTVESSVQQSIHLQHLTDPLEATAREWTWRGDNLDGPVINFLLARLDWAAGHYPIDQLDEDVRRLHDVLANLTGHAPQPTGRTCPGCGEAQLRILQDGTFTCDICEIARTPEEVHSLIMWRATTADYKVTPREAGKLLDIPEQTIYSWVRRGHLRRDGGVVSLAEVAQLDRVQHADSQVVLRSTMVHNETRAEARPEFKEELRNARFSSSLPRVRPEHGR